MARKPITVIAVNTRRIKLYLQGHAPRRYGCTFPPTTKAYPGQILAVFQKPHFQITDIVPLHYGEIKYGIIDAISDA
jgi:hypothetical protein